MDARFIDQVFNWLAHAQKLGAGWIPAALIAAGLIAGAISGRFGLRRAGVLASATTAALGGLVVCVLLLIGPQIPYTASEISEIERFVMDGGRLIVSAGWEERRGVERLLDRFGMSIQPIPFGRLAIDTSSGVVEMPKAWPLTVEDPSASYCLTKWDKPVAVTRVLGRGTITVIGDSMFLLNPNIETISNSRFFIRRALRFRTQSWSWHWSRS